MRFLSEELLAIIVVTALIMSGIAPVAILLLFARDWKRGKIW